MVKLPLMNNAFSPKSNNEILNKKTEEETQKATNKRIIQEAKTKEHLASQGINPDQEDHEKVLKEMAEEQQPTLQVPLEDTQNLIKSIETQRNNALTRLAVEQARIKSLLSKLSEKDQIIKELKETVEKLNNA